MMAYGYSIKKRNEKKTRARTQQLEPRLVLASLAMAAGIFAYPFGVEATTITPKDASDAAKIHRNGSVYDIDPQKSSGDFAYNRFSAFRLDEGHIANLKFGDAATLANLVNSKVDINGIVNGIKGGKIDGHLMFLSPDGIAVGAHGVINAGQFTGVVPTRTAFDTLYNAANITLDAVNTLKTGSYANDKNIEINGHINTHSGVMLGAGIINIKDGARIQSTKDVQFTDVVNTGSTGLSFVTTGTGGDIILTAKQTSEVKDANPIRWRDRSTDLAAAVNIGKNVAISNSDGAVTLTAESTSTYEDSTPMTLTDTLKGVIFGSEKTAIDGLIDKLAKKEAGANQYLFVNYSGKKNKSSVNVGENSNIEGKHIDIAAASTLEIKQSITVPAGADKKDSNGKTVPGGSKAVAAVAISRVYNNADVVIDGNLKATGADAENGDGIKIAVNADTKAALSAAGNGGDANVVAAGVAILTGDTKAKVTVNAPTNATALNAANGKASVEAVTKSDVDITVNAVGDTSYVVSNVGAANYDTGADVIINRSIQAGAVDVKAENDITGLKMTVDNTVSGSGSGNAKDTAAASDQQKNEDDAAANAEKSKPKSEDEKKSEQKSIDPTKVIKDASVDSANDEKTRDAAGADGKGGVRDVKDKVVGTNEGGDNAKHNSVFGLGTAVGVFSNKNDANVTIGKNAAITAAKPANVETPNGSVNVSARTIMQASAEKEDSLQLSVKNVQANANVEIGAAVLVSDVKNNAVVLLDSDGAKSARIKGGAISLDAVAGMGKYKATQPKKDDNGKDTKETEEAEKTSVLNYAVSAEGTAEDDNPSKLALPGSVGVNTLKDNAVVLLGQNSKVDGQPSSCPPTLSPARRGLTALRIIMPRWASAPRSASRTSAATALSWREKAYSLRERSPWKPLPAMTWN